MTECEYRTNNAYDTVLMVIDDTVVACWTVDEMVARDYSSLISGTTTIDEWDDQQMVDVPSTDPAAYGRRVAVVDHHGTAAYGNDYENRRSFFLRGEE